MFSPEQAAGGTAGVIFVLALVVTVAAVSLFMLRRIARETRAARED